MPALIEPALRRRRYEAFARSHTAVFVLNEVGVGGLHVQKAVDVARNMVVDRSASE